MALTYKNLIKELNDAKQYYLAQYLEDTIGDDDKKSCDLSNARELINALRGRSPEEAEEVVDVLKKVFRTHSGKFGNEREKNETISQKIRFAIEMACACQELGVSTGLMQLIQNNINHFHLDQVSKVNNVTKIIDEIINKLVKIDENAHSSKDPVESSLSGLEFEGTKLFTNFTDEKFVCPDNLQELIKNIKYDKLKRELAQDEPTKPAPVKFIELLNSKKSVITFSGKSYLLSEFRKKLFNALCNPAYNNLTNAFTDSLNALLNLDGRNAFKADDPKIVAAVQEIDSILTKGQGRYLKLINSEEIKRRPVLLALLKKSNVREKLIQAEAWQQENEITITLASDITEVLLRQNVASTPPAANLHALAKVLLGADKADEAFEAALVGSYEALQFETEHLSRLQNAQASDFAKRYPVFASVLLDFVKVDEDKDENIIIPAIAARSTLSRAFFFADTQERNRILANQDLSKLKDNAVKAEILRLFFEVDKPNTTTGIANQDLEEALRNDIFTDQQLHQIVGEARLKEYFGPDYPALFANDNEDYVKFCEKVGGYDNKSWRTVLRNEANSCFEIAVPAGTAERHKIFLRGYLHLKNSLGEAFLAALPANIIKQMVMKLGTFSNAELTAQLNHFISKAPDKINPTEFRKCCKDYLLDQAPTTADIKDADVKKLAGILRAQAKFDKNLIAALRHADPVFLATLETYAYTEQFWQTRLAGLQNEIMQAITRTDCDKNEAASILAKEFNRLRRYITPDASQTPITLNATQKIIGWYRFVRLQAILKDCKFNELADLLGQLSNDANKIKPLIDYLATHSLPDIASKCETLQAHLLASPNPLALEPLTEFFSGLVATADLNAFLRNLLPQPVNPATADAALPSALVKQAFLKHFWDTITQFAGPKIAGTLKKAESEINQFIVARFVNTGHLPQLSEIAAAAATLREKLLAAETADAAAAASEGFLKNFMSEGNIPDVTAKVLPVNNNDNVAQTNLLESLKSSAQQAQIIARIEDPMIARWLQDYKDANGNPLQLNYNHVSALNKLLRDIKDVMLSNDSESVKQHAIAAQINFLKNQGDLNFPASFPEKLFVKADGTPNTAYSFTTWSKGFKKLSIIRDIKNPELRLYALNNDNFLNDNSHTTNSLSKLKGLVDSINQDSMDISYSYVQIEDEASNQLNAILQATAGVQFFPANPNDDCNSISKSLLKHDNRVRAIKKHVKNPVMAELLISNPYAFADHDDAGIYNDEKIQNFARGLEGILKSKNEDAYKQYLKDNGLDNINGANGCFYEFYTQQAIDSCFKVSQAQNTLDDAIERNAYNVNNLKAVIRSFLETIDSDPNNLAESKKRLEEADKLLETDINLFSNGSVKEVSDKNQELEQAFTKVQAALVEKRDNFISELKYIDSLKQVLDEKAKQIKDKFSSEDSDSDELSSIAEEGTTADEQNSTVVKPEDEIEYAFEKSISKLTLYKNNPNRDQLSVEVMIESYNASIKQVSARIEQLQDNRKNLIKQVKAEVSEGREQPKGFYTDTFYADYVSPSAIASSNVAVEMRRRYKNYSIPTQKEHYVNLTPPANMPDAQLVFTSYDKKTIIKQVGAGSFIFEATPDPRSDKEPALKDNELLQYLTAAYKTLLKQHPNPQMKPGDFDKLMRNMKRSEYESARAAAVLLFENRGHEIYLPQMPSKAYAFVVMVELYRLSYFNKTALAVFGAEKHQLATFDLQRVANASLRKDMFIKADSNYPRNTKVIEEEVKAKQQDHVAKIESFKP